MKAYTDYPFTALGDRPYNEAPIRECEVVSYDGDKYCRIIVEGMLQEIKVCYIYTEPGRCGYAAHISPELLEALCTQSK